MELGTVRRESLRLALTVTRRAGIPPKAVIPFGCSIRHIQSGMQEFIDLLALIDATEHPPALPLGVHADAR